ncbi:MAG: ATP-binding protein [Rhodoglobus sp.]
MRLAVLPRDDAARVITSGISRGTWAVNSVHLVLSMAVLTEYMVVSDVSAALPVPLVLLVIMLGLAIWAAVNPRAWVVRVFLVAGVIIAVAYELALMSAYPPIIDEAFFIVNRPAVSLVLIGLASSTWLTGLAWNAAGFTVSLGVSFLVAAITGQPVMTGGAPILLFLIYVAMYLVFAAIQRSQRRQVPDFEELESETRRLAVEENLRSKVTAVVHDTLLNDLSLVMNAPETLDQRVVDRLRHDIATLTSTEWRHETEETAVDDSDAQLRNQIAIMLSELQWRGLSVHVTGVGPGIYRFTAGVATALLDAIRACLENVLRHSGAAVADMDIAYTADQVTVVISDQGAGFDPTVVADDRLGVRLSIIDRMRSVGGTARIWSSPGAGTSVVLSAPIRDIVTTNPESTHGRD